jgi:DNA polymerase-2
LPNASGSSASSAALCAKKTSRRSTAFGRDKLLRAKELAEARGYRMLHALTDSLWLKREAMNEADLLALCEEITQATEVEMSLEGIYRWIIFLPSKVNEDRPVACRYYGMLDTGKLKLRGLACRRSDTPPFIKEVQRELLAMVARAATLAERSRMVEQAREHLRQRIAELERGAVDPARLLVKRTLTKALDAYTVATRTALAARQLAAAGVQVYPGERLRFVVTEAKARDTSRRVHAEGIEPLASYDVNEYVKLLNDAADEVFAPRAVDDWRE